MQGIEPPTPDQLRGAGQRPFLKVEIWVTDEWINLCDLDYKNYVEGITISLGGAGMTPHPIGGTLSVVLSNEDSIFHPLSTSGYEDYIKAGRKVKISIGATYGVNDRYWQRIIGYIDEPTFETPSFKVNISGEDYMKFLQDAEFRPLDDAGAPDNYWGEMAEFNAYASTGLSGTELYAEGDALDTVADANNMTPWQDDLFNATFEFLFENGGGSAWVGKMVMLDSEHYVVNPNVCTVVAGKQYLCRFMYKREVGTSTSALSIRMYQFIGGVWKMLPGIIRNLDSDSWVAASFYFTALESAVVKMELVIETGEVDDEFWIDEVSIQLFTPYEERHYQLPGGTKGVHHVTLDGVDVWQGEEDEGWYYTEESEPGPDPPAHPPKIVWFDKNKTVTVGANNVKIYYYTTTHPEDAVARLLWKAGLYDSEVAALGAMENDDPDFTIDRVWFKVGTSFLNAVKMLCEVCDYRFHFEFDGTPVFKVKPTPDGVDFAFTAQAHIASVRNYQDRAEIKNRIVIEGEKQAEPGGKEEAMSPELRGEAADSGEGESIDTYGERTLTIKNHLFQDQTRLDDMCDSLLVEYKDPKWYADIEVPFNPVPLGIGDKITWLERLNPAVEETQTGMIRDIKISTFNTTYKCVIVG